MLPRHVLVMCIVGAVLMLAILMITAGKLGKRAPAPVTERIDRNL